MCITAKWWWLKPSTQEITSQIAVATIAPGTVNRPERGALGAKTYSISNTTKTKRVASDHFRSGLKTKPSKAGPKVVRKIISRQSDPIAFVKPNAIDQVIHAERTFFAP